MSDQLKAMLYLAQWYLDRGAMREAYRLFNEAARSHHPAALNMLGRVYERGWGTPRDLARAYSLFEQAAAGGEGWAFFNLGDLCLLGEGRQPDKKRAFHAYTEAARRGVGKAFNMLGLLLEEGYDDVPANLTDAQAFFMAGRDCGDEAAEMNFVRLTRALENRRMECRTSWLS